MNAVVQHVESQGGISVPANLAQAVGIAMERGDLEQVGRFMDLQERYEKNEARKAYVAAMAQFKQNPPEILKRKAVDFTNKANVRTNYKHATLADVCAAAIKGLADVGISHSWDTKQTGGKIVVTCTLTHEMGHQESTTLEAGNDDTGGKNAIQQMGSTITYLQRYTLKMITGLAEADDLDDDGKGAGTSTAEIPPPPVGTVEQFENWRADIQAVADEGSERLRGAWAELDEARRSYVVKHFAAWWGQMKARASAVQS